MALVASLRFLPDREADTADGWLVSLGNTASSSYTDTYYATITAAQTAIRTAFQNDVEVDAYFTSAAEASVLSTNASSVNSTKASLKTAEGL
jgi:hypothetical protein